ncbi:hypothetical protein PUN28_012208 [Cardiocondyla obscurior]|uniref:Uncharacterized protein n=1 Tax=Cardiocondyla obscurior TaxID=286306 RepID=A0AAW2FF19_9HYME
MSQCFRTLPGRLSSLVSGSGGGSGGRTPLSKLDRLQLQKNAESSAFLKQFLGTQRTLSVKANTAGKSASFVECVLHPNLSLAYFDIHNQQSKKSTRQCTDEKKNEMTYWVQPHRLYKSEKHNVAFLKSRKPVAPTRIALDNVKIFQTQSAIENYKNNSLLDNRIVSLENLHNSQNTSIDKSIVFTSDNTDSLKTSLQQNNSQSPHNNKGKPSQEQLQSVVDCLSQDLPKLFVRAQNFQIYTNDIIFINNIRGVTTRGLVNYAKQLMLLRLIGHIKFAYVKLDIIKITMHPENDTVQLRWRIRGISGWRVFTMFWKYRFWKIKDSINNHQEIWFDGFSTFCVNNEGKVYKHIADKMMPDQDTVTKKEDLNIAPKLALITYFTNIFGSNNNSFN